MTFFRDKNHPEYKLWKKNWDEEAEEVVDEGVDENVAMETNEIKGENLDSLESAAKMNSDLFKSGEKGDEKMPDLETHASTSEQEKKESENLLHDSIDHGAQSEEETGKDSSGESSVNADSESTLSAPEAIVHQNMQDHEAAMAEECIEAEIIHVKENDEVI